MTRRLALALALAATGLVLAACGEKQEPATTGAPQHVRLILDYLPNPDHAGIYEALADGAFRRAGLDVTPVVPSDPAAPLKLLASGRADIAISYEPELLLARDAGLDLVAIGALVQTPLTSVMEVGRSPVHTVRDLAGRTVGTAGIAYQSAYLKTILHHAGVDPGRVREVNVGFGLVPAMLTRKVDATLGAFWNIEGVQLQRAHRRPRITRVDQLGVPTYNELVLVARDGELRSKGPMFRAFMQALAQGHKAVRRNPAAAVDALLHADKDLDRGDTAAQVRATLPAFFPARHGAPFGFMEAAQWQAYAKWMQANGLLKRPATPRALTNEFLPGQGL